MAHEGGGPRDPHTTRQSRREPSGTDRLSPESVEDPVNPAWRRSRAAGRPAARRAPLQQEFALWLQYGGWKFLLAAVAIVLAGIVLYILSQSTATTPLQTTGNIEPEPQIVLTPLPDQPTTTPAPITSTLTLSPTTVINVQLRVEGTGALGLFLRPEPNTNGAPLKTIPEGALVTVVGEDSVQPDRVWKRIRDAEGSEGWAASEFLVPVSP